MKQRIFQFMNRKDSILRVYVKSEKVTVVSSDLTWGGNNCRQPMGTGKNSKSGKADGIYPVEHLMLLDAVARASNETGIHFEIVDIGGWSFLRKLKESGSSQIPRIEFKSKVLDGIPTSSEIIQFISESLKLETVRRYS